jgi:hypothetical protein
VPVVAPVGTVVVISELETTLNVATVPLNVGAQDLDGLSYTAGGGLCFHKRA